jgi:hypothetical protein
MKSPIMRVAAAPLIRLDAELMRDYVANKAEYDALDKAERTQEDRPQQRRLRLEDTTIEAAQEVLRDSPDGVLCLQDELSGWFGSMDKYTVHGGAKNRGFWLQSYGGGEYAVNRIGRGAFLIENLSVSMLGGIQPGPMREVAADTVDDGLLQRGIMLMLRPGAVGKDEPAPGAVYRYDHTVTMLHEMLMAPSEPLRFDDGALAIRERLEQKHHGLMAYGAVNRKLTAHIGKYNGLFARLCLLWHCIEQVQGQPAAAIFPAPLVSEYTAQRVERFLHEFLLPHALTFYNNVLGLADEHDRLTAVAGYILARRLDRITSRDVQRGDRTMRGLERRDIDSVFSQLEALGWLLRSPGARPGDPPIWNVNPEVHRRFEQRAQQEAERRRQTRELIAAMLGGKPEED